MLRRITYLLMIVIASLGVIGFARAETVILEVLHLPLREASDVVKSQLSHQGTAAQIPSRHMLIVQDNAEHIKRARALLKRLDILAPQLKIQVDVEERQTSDQTGARLSGIMLPGGWVRIQTDHSIRQESGHQHFLLRVTSGQYGRIEAGHIRAIRPSIRYFLHRYGAPDTPNLALFPITAGFDVQARLTGKNSVRLHIRPWFERQRQETNIQAYMEILPSLGSTTATRRPPASQAPMRLNIQPQQSKHTKHTIVTGADTRLTVKLGETVTLAAVRQTARVFGSALMDHYVMAAHRFILLRLTVTRAN